MHYRTLVIAAAMPLLLTACTLPWQAGQNGKATISGIFDLNGTIPQGATIAIGSRAAGATGNFTTVVSGLPTQDNGAWSINAVSGKSYELQATMTQNGQSVATSDPIDVTAPATNEVLRLNITNGTQTANATISGKVVVNGYIPSGATLTIEGKKTGSVDYAVVSSNLPAQKSTTLSYTTATAGQEYDVRATLYTNSGQAIGVSSVLIVSAPAANEMLTVNSTAVPPTPSPTTAPASAKPTPTPSSAISGNIQFNGAAPGNSSVVVLARVNGSGNTYQSVASGINPVNGSTWNWPNATTGTLYDMVAVLKQKNQNNTYSDVASSQTLTVAAPASNISFVINSGYSLSAPTGSINISCSNHDNNANTWNANVTFGSVQTAQSYWFQLGTTNGGTDTYNNMQNGQNNMTQSISLTIKDSVIYYARYAYANTQTNNWAAYSPFSSVTQVKCP